MRKLKGFFQGPGLIIAVLLTATAAWSLADIAARKVYSSGTVFTAADYNADIDFWVTSINAVRQKFPGDSVKVTTAAHDTLVASTSATTTIQVKSPLNIIAGNSIRSNSNLRADSLSVGAGPVVGFRIVGTAGIRERHNLISTDTLRIVDSLTVGVAANGTILAGATFRSIANFRADSLSVGSVPVVGFRIVGTAGIRERGNFASFDTVRIVDSLTVGVAAKGTILAGATFQSIANFRADSSSVGSGPVVGFRVVGTAGIRSRGNLLSQDTLRIVDSLTVGVAAKTTILAGATTRSIANFRADSLSVGSVPVVGYVLVSSSTGRSFFNHVRSDTVVVGSVPVVGYAMAVSGANRSFFNMIRSDTLAIGSASVIGYALAVSGSNNALFGNNIIVTDNAIYGLSASTGRIEIDDQTVDEINFLGATVGIGTATPGTAAGELATTGSIFINDNANAFMTTGFTSNQGTADNEGLALMSSDVVTPFTDNYDPATYGTLQKAQAAAGGVQLTGISDADAINAYAAVIVGRLGEAAQTGASTTTAGIIQLEASVTSGTGFGAAGADAVLVQISTGGTTRFIFDAEGTGKADDVWTDNAYDLAEDYDIFYAPAKDTLATRRSNSWSTKDTCWTAKVDTVSLKKGVPTQVEQGTVLTVDTTHDNRLTPSTAAYQVVAGIISFHTAQLGNAMGNIMEKFPQLKLEEPANQQPVALVGIVPTKLTNDNGNISRGDVLVAADRDGYAMKIGVLPMGLVLTSRHIVGVALMECAAPECFANVQR